MSERAGRVWLWRWRRNPLRRRSDVAEAWVRLTAAALLLLLVPTVGVVAAVLGERAALDRAQGLHRTAAHLVEDAPTRLSRFSGTAADDQVRAPVWWTTPDGSVETGVAPVAAGGRAGSATTVWLDLAGRPRPDPPTPSQARSQGAAIGVSAGAGACVLVVGGWWAARVCLDGRRGRRWDQAWARFDAQRGQRRP
jgi:hypothetical protein